ncbi:MAG: hypothetical protein BMS9Abin07_0123 [Acidimicrobiia bacterium]|nr:MAG: hypothetical protein BMS9Abin07_0123 [Acidimicrobiia bacterium]
MADELKSQADDVVDLTEITALREENEALRTQLESQPERHPVWRKVLAGTLAVLAILTLVVAVDALWLKTTLEDEDQFVATFDGLTQDDAVAEFLSTRVASGIVESQEVQTFVADRLPDELSLLAAPITASIEQLIARAANEVIRSDAAATVWAVNLRGTHIAVSALLTGNDGALQSENGQIAINLDELAVVIVDRVEAGGVDLPDIDFELGSIVIYESDELATAQGVAQGISTAGWVLPVVALLLIAAAVWVAVDRRRMVAILGFATAIAMLIQLAADRVAQNAVLGGIEDDLAREAGIAVWDTTFSRLTSFTWALLVLALIVGLLAWLLGPSTRAQRLSSWGAKTIDGWRRPTEEEPSGFTTFLAEWKRTIQVVVTTLGLLFVLFGPTPSGLLVIATFAAVLGVVVLVEVMAGPTRAPTPDREDAEV